MNSFVASRHALDSVMSRARITLHGCSDVYWPKLLANCESENRHCFTRPNPIRLILARLLAVAPAAPLEISSSPCARCA